MPLAMQDSASTSKSGHYKKEIHYKIDTNRYLFSTDYRSIHIRVNNVARVFGKYFPATVPLNPDSIMSV